MRPLKINYKRDLVILLLLAVALQQLASAGLIKAKAHLAQFLIASAWEKTLASNGGVEKPWPWADTWPVARLEVPRHQVDLYILAGARGNSLAFGPGHETASARPGRAGVTVIGGHRDTHFNFLQGLEPNTLLSLQLPSGKRRAYQVIGAHVVDTQREPYFTELEVDSSELLLVTCYPFDALRPGGPLRYVVTARPVLMPTRLQSGAYDL